MKDNSTINSTYSEEVSTQKDNTFNMTAALVILRTAFSLIKYYAFIRFCRNASINLHHAMSSRVITAVMRFFDTHYIGNILNRFSYDLNNIDGSIPFLFPILIAVSIFYYQTKKVSKTENSNMSKPQRSRTVSPLQYLFFVSFELRFRIRLLLFLILLYQFFHLGFFWLAIYFVQLRFYLTICSRPFLPSITSLGIYSLRMTSI